MLKAFTNFILFSLSDLMDAIDQGNTERALLLIERADTVNKRRNIHDLTPLQASLLKKNFRVTAALLEKGADPNAPFLFSDSLGSAFSVQIIMGDLDTIKLMLLHGAKPDERDWQIASHLVEGLVTSLLPIQNEILESQNSHNSCVDSHKNQQRLIAIWQKCAQNEHNPIYRQYYQQRASKLLTHSILSDVSPHKTRKQKIT